MCAQKFPLRIETRHIYVYVERKLQFLYQRTILLCNLQMEFWKVQHEKNCRKSRDFDKIDFEHIFDCESFQRKFWFSKLDKIRSLLGLIESTTFDIELIPEFSEAFKAVLGTGDLGSTLKKTFTLNLSCLQKLNEFWENTMKFNQKYNENSITKWKINKKSTSSFRLHFNDL